MSGLRRLKAVFRLVYKADRGYFLLLLLSALSHSGRALFNVAMPKLLIDALMGVPGAGDPASWAALIAAGNLLFTLLIRTAARVQDLKEQSLAMEIDRAFSEKLMGIPYWMLEDPHYLDLKERASFAMRNQGVVRQLVVQAVSSLNHLLTVAGLVALMLQLGLVLVLSLAATVALLLAIQAGFSRYQQRFFGELLPVNRRYGYYINLCFRSEPQKDFRLFVMQDLLGETITRYNRSVNTWYAAFFRKMGLAMGLFQAVTVLQAALAWAFVGMKTLKGSVGIGSLTLYVSAAVGFSTSVIALGSAVIDVARMLHYLEPFVELMELPAERDGGGGRTLRKVESIRFEEVSFTYPKIDDRVLDRVSFDIRGGERVSIVGRNGAGKSTIVKLLCCLYAPDSGRILINGADLREYDRQSLLKGIAAVFQDFKLFYLSVGDNITCGQPEDRERLEAVVREVGLESKVASLPRGLSTPLGKAFEEGAVELSGGERQKAALARALYKNAPLLILDEPTSALDPLAEAEVYGQMDRMAGDNTALFISHRMSSSVFCDRILVLDEGRVQAFDTHAALMKDEDGLYARLFRSQAEHYRLNRE